MPITPAIADELADSFTDGLSTVARDVNGDVWVAWWRYVRGMYWTHTYTSAIAGTPRLVGHGRNRVVAWALSEPAPESWWAVLRARGNGPFEEVARVRAGPEVEMSWADDSPPAGILRYKVRRESLDKRYEWLSDEVSAPVGVPQPSPVGERLQLARASGNPSTGPVRLQVLNAPPGGLRVQIYDLRGRLLLEEHHTAGGLGQDSIVVDLARASPAPGLYFLRVLDAAGRASPSVKFVFLH